MWTVRYKERHKICALKLKNVYVDMALEWR